MSKCVRSARVRRVSSQATRSTSRRTRSARRVMSSRLPIGVATTKSVPLRLRRLLLRFRDEEGPLAVQDDLARDDALLEPLDGRQLVHDLEHDLLQDRPEPARAGPPLERLLRDGRHRVVRELQADLLEVEVLLVLLDDRVLRLPQDADERRLVEVVERRDDGQPADELGDEPVLQEVLGLDHRQEVAHPAFLAPFDLRAKAHAGAPDARLDDLVEPDEGAAAEEEDVRRVDLDELLVRMLPPALGRHVGDRALEDLEQGLLDAFPGDVPGDRGILGLARDLVDFVDVDDAALRPLHVIVRRLEQAQDDVLDVLADVARLRERGGVGDRERHAQHLGERLREEGLAGARGADHEDVRLLQLDVARLAARLIPLIVIVDRDGEDLLGPLLADHVLVEDVLDLGGLGKRADLAALLFLPLLSDDVVAELDALVADVDRRAGDQFADVVLALPAERALQRSVAFARSGHRLSTCDPASPTPPPRPPPGSSAWRKSRRPQFYSPSPVPRSSQSPGPC